jgi:hypothetical protein
VFTSTRHRHHYVNIDLQNIIAIQDPHDELLTMPMLNNEQRTQTGIVHAIEHEISVYEDTTRTIDDTFQIFSQIDTNSNERLPMTTSHVNGKSSTSSAFTNIKPQNKLQSINQKFSPTISGNVTTDRTHHDKSHVRVCPPSSIVELDLLHMIDKPIDSNLSSDGKSNRFAPHSIDDIHCCFHLVMAHVISDIDNDDFFTTW